MNVVVHECESLTEEDITFLQKIGQDLSILADLSRADVLMYCPLTADRAVLVAQASPHSILPIYGKPAMDRQVTFVDEPAVIRALVEGHRGFTEVRRRIGDRESPEKAAPIVQETHPIRASDGRVIAAICIETNLIERERHRRRSKVFQKALKQFQETVLTGNLLGAEQLTSFAEHDGVVVVDTQHRIQYISGIATSLYRKLGYAGDLLKYRIEDLELDDHGLVLEAMEQGRCLEAETRVGDLVWVKKALPFFSPGRRVRRLLGRAGTAWRLEGVLLTVRDETEARRQEEELRVKVAMIQEIHHRVKNNLQVIASLLRLQARRTDTPEVQVALSESVNRILSVAVVHEFLSYNSASVINLREVAQRIVDQIMEGVMDPEARIRFRLTGPSIYLSAQKATACALVLNELLLNAVEHGYENRDVGKVTIDLVDDGEWVTIEVGDDGAGLPPGFDLEDQGGLGLRIVRTLVQGDLKGDFSLHAEKGVRAIATFPKTSLGGARS
jgi:two-component sensor histidine kinase/PAS domain-containing protein